MKKIIYSLTRLILFLVLTILPLTISCNQVDQKQTIIIALQVGWKKIEVAEKQKFYDDLEIKINKYKDKNLENKKIIINWSSNDEANLRDLLANKIDFAIPSHTSINEIITSPSQIKFAFSTLTNSFFNDQEAKYYQDGSSSDYLRIVAEELDRKFKQKIFASWTKKNGYDWNGSIYTNFYNLNKKVNFHRGSIMIFGNENKRREIKQAWDKKDWQSFKNFGIIHGDVSSGGRYLMQQALLKKHFNKTNNSFTTLAQEIMLSANKFNKKEAHLFGDDPNYRICFDEQASFAWKTISKQSTKDYFTPKYTKNDIDKNARIEIFILTDPLKYNFGIANKRLSNNLVGAIAEAFIELSNQKLDVWGPTYGFNAYQYLLNPLNPYKEIFESFQKTIRPKN